MQDLHGDGGNTKEELRVTLSFETTGCSHNCFPICNVAPATSNGPVWSWQAVQGSFGVSKQVSLTGHSITPLLEGCGAAIGSHGTSLLTAVLIKGAYSVQR